VPTKAANAIYAGTTLGFGGRFRVGRLPCELPGGPVIVGPAADVPPPYCCRVGRTNTIQHSALVVDKRPGPKRLFSSQLMLILIQVQEHRREKKWNRSTLIHTKQRKE